MLIETYFENILKGHYNILKKKNIYRNVTYYLNCLVTGFNDQPR